jgi:hypothetical protein
MSGRLSARVSNASRPQRRIISRVEFDQLKAALDACSESVTRLIHDNDLHIKRMAAMQAEIDDLRAKAKC